MRYRVNRSDTTRKPHKYGAVRTEIDGISFASKAEAKRYAELKLLEKACEIQGLELQPAFELVTIDSMSRRQRVGAYVADFRYYVGFQEIVEDVKGVKTPLYNWKKKHFQAQYGITITEVA